MRIDDDVPKEILEGSGKMIVRLMIKVKKLTISILTNSLRWYIQNSKKKGLFSETGKIDMAKLHTKYDSVKILPNEVSLEELKEISKQFKKYSVTFAVEKTGEDLYAIAFAGKSEETIEYAMKQVIKQQDEKIRKAQLDKGKTTVEKIEKRYEEKNRQRKEKSKEKAKGKAKGKSKAKIKAPKRTMDYGRDL